MRAIAVPRAVAGVRAVQGGARGGEGSAQGGNGWYETYIHCVDNQGPKLVLKAYQALTEDDPDKNVQLLRR